MNEKEGRKLGPLTNPDIISESLITSESRVGEKLGRQCFKPRYHLRRVKNKGAILVLIWSYFVSCLYFYISYNVSRIYSHSVFSMIQTTVGLTIPLTGWLADIRFGRYKVIRFSLWTMWISSMLLTASLVIIHCLDLYNLSKILHAFLVPLALGYGGFQANIIQFGVDQLCDASSSEIKTFITWYSWALISSIATVSTAVLYISEEYKLFVSLLVCLNLTLAVTLGILFNNVLIKEPVTQNPFRTVYGVIKYAIKHKSPRQRSAFTYCEDELPSRIDIGKSKYGGPFITEQVEDVKTLFRVALVFLVGCAFFGMTMQQRSIHKNLRNIFITALSHPPQYIFSNFYSITGVFLVPLYEITVYPLFHSCLPTLKSYAKFLVGFALRLVRYATLLALLVYARQRYAHTDHTVSSSNITLLCILYTPHESPNSLSTALDYRWMILLEALLAISDTLIVIGSLEFYCAQVPYSMKGLVAGIIYSFLGFFMILSQVVLLPFTMRSLEWGTGTLSCGFWYLVTLLVYLVIVMTALVVVMRWYKKRKREDVLPNEQIFAERYYSRN